MKHQQLKVLFHTLRPGSESPLGACAGRPTRSPDRGRVFFDRLIVFQRMTPTANNPALALVFVCLTSTLTWSLPRRMTSAPSVPIASSNCVQQDVSPYLLFFSSPRLHYIPVWFCMVVSPVELWDYSRISSSGLFGFCTLSRSFVPPCGLLLTRCVTQEGIQTFTVRSSVFTLDKAFFIFTVYPRAVARLCTDSRFYLALEVFRCCSTGGVTTPCWKIFVMCVS